MALTKGDVFVAEMCMHKCKTIQMRAIAMSRCGQREHKGFRKAGKFEYNKNRGDKDIRRDRNPPKPRGHSTVTDDPVHQRSKGDGTHKQNKIYMCRQHMDRWTRSLGRANTRHCVMPASMQRSRLAGPGKLKQEAMGCRANESFITDTVTTTQ